MSIKLDLSEVQAAKYLEFIEEQIDELYSKLNPLLDQRDDLVEAITDIKKVKIPATVKQQSINIPLDSTVFNPNGTNISKIKFVLGETKIPTYTRNIIERIFELQPELKVTKEMKDKTAKNISTVLSIGNGKDFNRTTDDNGNYLFTLKD